MIGKIKNLAGGHHLARLAAYLRGPQGERVADYHTMNLSTSDLGDVVVLMDAQSGLSRRAKKPMAHITVSYAPTDRVTRAQMLEDAQRLLLALGAEQAQAFMVIHDDKEYQHFHLVMNRVKADGRCISDSNTKRKIESVLRKVESERGLRPVPGRHAPVIGRPEAGHFKGARAPRRGYVQPPAEVVEVMRQAQSRDELDERLGRLGWRLDATPPKPGQKSGGMVLRGPQGALARASDCGRHCSGPALARRFAMPAVSQTGQPALQVAPVPRPRPAGTNALESALRKAKAKPRIPRIAPSPTVTGIIRRVVPVPGPRLKF